MMANQVASSEETVAGRGGGLRPRDQDAQWTS
jgi:hypothetical protein